MTTASPTDSRESVSQMAVCCRDWKLRLWQQELESFGTEAVEDQGQKVRFPTKTLSSEGQDIGHWEKKASCFCSLWRRRRLDTPAIVDPEAM